MTQSLVSDTGNLVSRRRRTQAGAAARRVRKGEQPYRSEWQLAGYGGRRDP